MSPKCVVSFPKIHFELALDKKLIEKLENFEPNNNLQKFSANKTINKKFGEMLKKLFLIIIEIIVISRA